MKAQRTPSKTVTLKIGSPSRIPVPDEKARLRKFNPFSEQKQADLMAWKNGLRGLREDSPNKTL